MLHLMASIKWELGVGQQKGKKWLGRSNGEQVSYLLHFLALRDSGVKE